MTAKRETGKRVRRRTRTASGLLTIDEARVALAEHDTMRKVLLGNGGRGVQELAQQNAIKIERLLDLIDGNPALDIKGVRPRIVDVETALDVMKPQVALVPGMKGQLDSLVADRDKVRWVALGLGLTGLANVGLLATVIKVVFFPAG